MEHLDPSLISEPNLICLTSESHAYLFHHDEEIISKFQAQMDLANEQLSCLENKLRASIEDSEATRSALYESETARNNEMQGRMAFQRHLQLEQHLHSGCAQTRLSLEEEGKRTRIEMDTLHMVNEMLREELRRHESVIESMGTKLSTYQSAAESLVTSSMERTKLPGGHEILVSDEAGSPDPFTFVTIDKGLNPYPNPTVNNDSSSDVSISTATLVAHQACPVINRKPRKLIKETEGGKKAKKSKKQKPQQEGKKEPM
ncbi:hypothetical protein BKA61DRAFT_711965 [Leptodontidium sp. MPI-SDFR-AT-0119]|nr:hypothetical protein BKA61DRAFT_711965 [Leptodontidium sp. MPI-SDFR-AT-0119]